MTKKRKKRKKPIARPQFNPPNIVIVGLALIIGIALFSAVDKIFYSKNKIVINKHKNISELLTVSKYEEEYGEKISIQLLNGCGKKGLAENYSVFLINKGHDVKLKANAPHHKYQYSEIIIRNANRIAAENLAQIMGISHDKISTEPYADLQCDITVILGNDYKDLSSYSPMLSVNPIFELSK